MRSVLVLLSLSCIAACTDDPVSMGDDLCMPQDLPFSGGANAPVVTAVELEIQSDGIVVTARATDPQGFANVDDLLQTVGLFPDVRCEGAPIVLRDDLVGLDVEETFGTAVHAESDPALYAEIVGSNFWPAVVDFVDRDMNRTQGHVSAIVLH